MNEIVVLLAVLLVIAAGNFLLSALLWWRHAGLAERVTKIEAYQHVSLTNAESRQIYERLAGLEGQIHTTNQLLRTVQDHLMERT